MKFPMYIVDAFTSQVFSGNQAAVILLKEWLPDNVLQKIAAENNLSETAFIKDKDSNFEIRWMTPTTEIDLCGHATLASAHILLHELRSTEARISFQSKSGMLGVSRGSGGLLTLDFPSRPGEKLSQAPGGLLRGLRSTPLEVYRSRDVMAVFETEDEIRALAPDFDALREVDATGIIATAPGKKVDFVSRFFAPRIGILEDPVTGASHCSLTPYWAKRLKKNALHAAQLSARGGELFLNLKEDRVEIGGHATTYLRGEIEI
jgi:predicted PhzF superfamily epimerase YddE/YHI9